MILIGENIQILSKVVSESMKSRDAKPLQELAQSQAEKGVHYIDLNIGPARKDPQIMEWLVRVVQGIVDLPLSLDSTNPLAVEAGLKICKKKALINSASGKRESKENMLPLAKKYNCDVIVSVLNDSGIPADAEGRAESIMETVSYANELGIPNEDIWVDPIMMPISADQVQVAAYLEFIKMLPDLLPGCKSTLGLSNLSNGTPAHLRYILNRTYFIMIGRYNQYSAIVDSFDEEILAINRGERQNIVNLIYKVMDERYTDLSGLSGEEKNYAKTVKVLLGETLYSHSWLEV